MTTHYILFNTVMEEPVMGAEVIYDSEKVIELYNDGFKLEEDEQFVRIVDLPDDIMLKCAKQLACNPTINTNQ